LDGAVNVLWVNGLGPWQGPVPLTAKGFAQPGTLVALNYQASMNQLDAVVVGLDGAVNVLWVNGLGPWQGPVPLTAKGFV